MTDALKKKGLRLLRQLGSQRGILVTDALKKKGLRPRCKYGSLTLGTGDRCPEEEGIKTLQAVVNPLDNPW